MITTSLVFIAVWFLIIAGVMAWKSADGNTLWRCAKWLTFGLVTAIIASCVVVSIVILF